MPIYTKKGDKGNTSIFSPKEMRVSKDSLRIEAIGTVDELNSFLGVAISCCENKKHVQLIKLIQSNLLTVGSCLAGSSLKISKRETTKLERQMDIWESEMPKLTNFILPGGTKAASSLQYCRSLTRRAERKVVAYSKVGKVSPQVMMYINRLSDFFFMFARYVNFQNAVEDEVWKK
ncbi:cob(I)yrinic acid a,c-diamide adenosyltransferase [Candidatus Woesebacteria bacterium]|nr:MAG: cob(I)yrinic acid a,c-diamide adenosyltransferase [Candidatus Woesebacteria bacterium]